ncbi:Capsule polysaccharide biosynthesis [Candidatus Planktophila dulcis]|uniref:capsular polysaccharide export protein, LipB/KpsS family n=1 Tax=Candidatus Planktophila dulcis TaxID=1884914 RepID=UPI003CEE8BBB
MHSIEGFFDQPDGSLFVTLNHNSPHDAATALEIAKSAKNRGLTVSIINLSPLTGRGRTQAFEMILRNHVWNSPNSPINKVSGICMELDIGFLDIPKNFSSKTRQLAHKLAADLPESLSELEEWFAFDNDLGPSLASHLVTLVSLDENLNPRLFRKDLKRQIQAYLHIKEFVIELLHGTKNPIVSVFNGRLPAMAAVVSAGRATNSKILWHEIGRTRDYFFLEDFSPHDRIKMQKAMAQFAEVLPQSTLNELTNEFISGRRVDLALNKFLAFQNTEPGDFVKGAAKMALILTSSPDETVGIGKSWSGVEWPNQYVALNKAILKLQELGFHVIVRIHPNIASKSWGEYFRAVHSFRHISEDVYLPTDYVNTYDLIDQSAVVVVWRSTTGLEANAIGKPTFCMGLSRYDSSADVRTLHSEHELSECTFSEYKVDRSKALAGILWSKFAARHPTTIEYKDFISGCDDYLAFEARRLRLLYFLLPFNLPGKIMEGPRVPIKTLFSIVGQQKAAKIIRGLHRFGALGPTKLMHRADWTKN